MRRIRLALLLALALALPGCAGPNRLTLDELRNHPDRPNGQPKWLPCMIGDALCS